MWENIVLIVFWAITIVTLWVIFLPLFIEQKKTIVTHKHQYKVSTDYERLWDLIMEGRHIVVLEVDSDGDRWPHMAKVERFYDGDFSIYGFGADMGKIYTKEDFVNYCRWKKYEYLDQIDFENIE